MKHTGHTRRILFFTSTLMLFSCHSGLDQDTPSQHTVTAEESVSDDADIIITETIETEEWDLSGIFDEIRGMVITEDEVIVTAGFKNDRPTVALLDTEGTVQHTFMPDAPEDITVKDAVLDEDLQLMRLCENRDGGFTLFFPSLLQVYDSQGNLTEKISFDGLEGKESAFDGPFHLGEKRYLFWGNHQIAELREEGDVNTSFLSAEYHVTSVFHADDRILAYVSKGGGDSLKLVDPEEYRFEEYAIIPDSLSPSITKYSGMSDTIFFHDGNAVYVFHTDDYKVQKLFDWLQADITDPVRHMAQVQDDMYLCAAQNETTLHLIKTGVGQQKRKRITVATVWPYKLDLFVARFNARNQNFFAEVKRYDYDNQQLLLMDIATGNAPDVIAINEVSIPLSEDIFVDLLPFIDADPDLSRNDFVQNVLNLSLVNGHLLCAFDSFAYETIIGSVSDIGTASTWTTDAVLQLLDNNTDRYSFASFMTPDNLLKIACVFSQGQYIDWDNLTCDFENESFINLLKFCKIAGERRAPDHVDMFDESILLTYFIITDPGSLPSLGSAYGTMDLINQIGFPNEMEKNGTCLYREPSALAFSIPHNTEDKEAAWTFIRDIYSDSWQEDICWKDVFDGVEVIDYYTPCFPVMESALDKRYASLADHTDHSVPPDYTERSKEFIEHIEFFFHPDIELSGIILEESMYYLEGVKTAEEVAAIIQSRVSLLLAERKN